MGKPPNERRLLVVRAVDLVIAEVQIRDLPAPDREEQLATLHRLRDALLDGDGTLD
jgi:hypothetical protein